MHLLRTSRFGLLLGLLVLTTSGFGCKKPTTRPTLSKSLLESSQLSAFATPNPKPAEPPYVRKEKTDRGVPPEVVEMRQTLRNLNQTTSFRATLLIPSAEGTATGELEYVQSQGIHGTLSINGQFISELYKIDQTIYFKQGTSTWRDLTTDPEAREAVTGFQQAVNFSDDPGTAIRDIARITKTEQDPSGCKAYDFWQLGYDGEKETYRLCLKDGYPVSISKQTPGGTVQIHYRDINKSISLKTPVIGN